MEYIEMFENMKAECQSKIQIARNELGKANVRKQTISAEMEVY
jgi:hypothetical protein